MKHTIFAHTNVMENHKTIHSKIKFLGGPRVVELKIKVAEKILAHTFHAIKWKQANMLMIRNIMFMPISQINKHFDATEWLSEKDPCRV
jgi:hypothetical protein